ncbi:hypothetical protein [Ruminococcus sp. NK3A76]|uniref:hypothetical protein n=1 Tax=Ruminococcus sp. NK3A76 TaxID=877411 RepID=UPI000AFE77A6|nr:hypothetical protein [Ruminococcus sp. NK3A76]
MQGVERFAVVSHFLNETYHDLRVRSCDKKSAYEIAKKWTMPLRNWGKVLGELEIMYPDRIG